MKEKTDVGDQVVEGPAEISPECGSCGARVLVGRHKSAAAA